MTTNCLGQYLSTQLLLPIFLHTAESAPPAIVRVIWTSSIAVDASGLKDETNISELTNLNSDQQRNYLNSKTGNWFLASELAGEVGSNDILNVTENPGNLKTGLLRHALWILGFVTSPLLYPAKIGAYIELRAGFSGDLGIQDRRKYEVP